MLVYHTPIPSDIFHSAIKNTWKIDSSNVGFRIKGYKGDDSLNLSSFSDRTQLWSIIYIHNYLSIPLKIDSAFIFSNTSGRILKCRIIYPSKSFGDKIPLIPGYSKTEFLIGATYWEVCSENHISFDQYKNILEPAFSNRDFVFTIYTSQGYIKIVPLHYIIYDSVLRILKEERL